MALETPETPVPSGTNPSEANVKPATPEVKPTALTLLLQVATTGEVDFRAVMKALKAASSGDSSGLIISVSEIRKYLQHSGKKVARGADNLLAIGINVALMKTFYRAIHGTGAKISFADSLTIVNQEFGITFSDEQLEVLQLAYGQN